MKPQFFPNPPAFRKWLEDNHSTATELLVGFHKVDSGKPSITWPESVDEALCFGWIDGIRRRIDDVSYSIRFTPRKKTSTWSAVNIRRVEALVKEGKMTPAGIEAYNARKDHKAGIYSYEQRLGDLSDPYGKILRKNKKAWDFFSGSAPSYRKAVIWWVLSAKKEETRLSRLQTLIADSSRGRKIGQMERLESGKTKRV
jgi:uncharacterized protein YdeI (YjbR/CyaY-like superfamily)